MFLVHRFDGHHRGNVCSRLSNFTWPGQRNIPPLFFAYLSVCLHPLANLVVESAEVDELVDGSLLGEEHLVEHATEADHGEAGVLELSELEAGEENRRGV